MADRFYILDTRQVVGNCALWWCPNGNGYTTQLEEAGLYSEEETRGHRDTDVAVPEAVAKACAVTHVRLDRLRESFDVKPKPARARLDADGTARGKTILTAPVFTGSEGTQHVLPGSYHIDTETGVRTPLASRPRRKRGP